jgi:AcrR family transcriptional regulator
MVKAPGLRQNEVFVCAAAIGGPVLRAGRMPTLTVTTRGETRERVTRRDVLKHAAELFAERGYKATNLSMVADRLGVTRQALYYHFNAKGDILAALFEEQMTALEAAAASAQVADGGALFPAMLREHLKVILSNTDLTAVLVHERPETDRIEGLRAHQRRRAYTNQLATAYAAGVKDGQLRPVDSLRAANAILAAANSITWWYHPQRSAATQKQVLDDMITLLSSGFLLNGG